MECIETINTMDFLSNQTIVQCKNNIETIDDLYHFIDKNNNKVADLVKVRQKYHNKIRYCHDENEIES